MIIAFKISKNSGSRGDVKENGPIGSCLNTLTPVDGTALGKIRCGLVGGMPLGEGKDGV